MTPIKPYPALRTDRLVLRKLRLSDAEHILKIRSNDEVNRYLDRPKTLSITEAEEFIKKINTSIANNQSFYWAITLKDQKTFAGTICIWNINAQDRKAETGYELHPDHQKKGIMQEALCKVLDFGFNTLGLRTIEAAIDAANNASLRLVEKCGFKIQGNLEEKGRNDIPLVCYTVHSAK